MSVNARELLIKAKAPGVDPLVDLILDEKDNAEKALYVRAIVINKSKLKKRYVEACLLASTDYERIADILDIPLDVLMMYHDIFYDVVECDKLSRLELIDCKDKDEHMMKLWAMSQGLDFIEWRLGRTVLINPVEGLKDLFTTCVYKSKEAMFSGNASVSSAESTKWVKLSLDIARMLKVWTQDMDIARRDIEMALSEVIPEFKSFADLDKVSLVPAPSSNTDIDIDEPKEILDDDNQTYDFPGLPE
jgi:hypothetical protein